ncbi:hypothetical protein [Gehongia tenuis]|uniref:Uncharacterized protein n=1 Tax=Gehongia tenuis TaxID=2763655 RepID=A0A926D7W9_9FIRM|nr:hypothetical protein [Gehongia tenuis]MBC8532020.1 hypothetical protein [Gehongia tenuis]
MRKALKFVVPAAVFLALAAAVLLGSGLVRDRTRSEGGENVRNALRQAVVTCYALEGAYPPSVAYLEENYGLRINHDAYRVHYQLVADNLFPELQVIEKK